MIQPPNLVQKFAQSQDWGWDITEHTESIFVNEDINEQLPKYPDVVLVMWGTKVYLLNRDFIRVRIFDPRLNGANSGGNDE